MSTPLLQTAIPQLPSSDLQQTKTFMVSKLGFECVADHGQMIIVRRDSAELHFWHATPEAHAKALASESSCYIRVKNIEALFGTLKANRVEFGYELKKKPWGMTEMQVNDPDGNAIRFGEAAS
jgi:catechol 2,3-dioxygenase-like lactoylglutathione lyase family enzyme